ncbi:hypothetical protein DOY81_003672, partial [Sarcophaga bullata]
MLRLVQGELINSPWIGCSIEQNNHVKCSVLNIINLYCICSKCLVFLDTVNGG